MNPRGPLANAKVNKQIQKTLATEEGRSTFHLLNNGLCATCTDYRLDGETLEAEQFQIVNGCQTTVTLAEMPANDLEKTLVDLKLTIADPSLAASIAEASNSQTALKAKDYASFEKQQRSLQYEFEQLMPPWFYEIKQGYWTYVLSDKQRRTSRLESASGI